MHIFNIRAVIWLLLAFLVAIPTEVFSATITGTVYDAKTGVVIADILVSVQSSSGEAIGTTITDDTGVYALSSDEISEGDVIITFSADGYVETFGTFIVSAGDTIYLESVYISPASSELGIISGTIIDATTQNTVIPNVSLSLIGGINQSGDNPLITITSESDGSFLISDVEAGTYTLIAEKDGYTVSPIIVNSVGGETKSYEHSMSPVVAQGEIRIILTWGVTPLDLDSHTFTPEIEGSSYHIDYTYLGSLTALPYVNLDRDDTVSYGPETTTITQTFEGIYSFKVHNYSETPSLATSGAVVKILDSTGLLFTVNVPSILPGDGLWWDVLRFDGATGRFTTPEGIPLGGGSYAAPSMELSDKDSYACFISIAGN